MARKLASRKYQLTINHPEKHGFTHVNIKEILDDLSGLKYWCMCDEVGKEGTPHTHVYLLFNNAVMFTTLQKRFYGAHIEPANGSNQENRNYIRKEGKWMDDEKNETNLIETFEESGEMPLDKAASKKETEEIYQMIKDGASNYEILEAYPNAMNKLDKIEKTRQVLRNENQKCKRRILEISYIWGDSGVGKTRSVMDRYGDDKVYRVTNYVHPFDSYDGEDVILFDEFRSNLPFSDFLMYLDPYAAKLPCRYADKQACYSTVYIISNIPLDQQYEDLKRKDIKSWNALKRRIKNVTCMLPVEKGDIFDWTEELEE